MVVWWSVFAYMIIVSGIGMMLYNNGKQTNIGSVDDFSAKSYKSIGLFFALLSFALLVYFSGKRTWIFDTSEYIYSYNVNPSDLSYVKDIITGKVDLKGPGYFVLLTIFKSLTGADYSAWFTFIAIIQCTALAIFFYRYSVNFTLSCYLFFSSSCFLWLVNGMRQFLVATIVLFFFDWIKQKKIIPFVILIILLYTIHSSVLLWIPVFLLVNYKPWSKKFIILAASLMVFILLISKSGLFNDSEYEYVSNDSFEGVNPLRVIVMSIPAIIAFIKRKKIEKKATIEINVLINLSVICAGCFIIGMFSNGFVARLAVYFQVFNYVLLPWLLKNAFDEDTSKIITTFCLIGFMGYFCYDMYIAGNGIY